MAVVFPNSNLPISSQPWAREIQRQLSTIIDVEQSNQINNLARDNQLQTSVSSLTNIVNNIKILTDDETSALGLATTALSTANTALSGLTSLASTGSSYTVFGANISGGTISGANLILQGSSFQLTVGETTIASYLSVSPTSGGTLLNTASFSAASSANVSGWASNFFPRNDNINSMGESGKRWTTVFATTGTINTSDARLKTQVAELGLGLDFVKSLKPVSYKWIQSSDQGTYAGLLAQDVQKAIKDSKLKDFAALFTEGEDGIMGLRYSEFIAPLIKSVQELSDKIDKLEGK
jgi:hypothetical protein